MNDLKYWLGFNLVKGIGPARLQSLLDYFGNDVAAAWQATEFQLQKLGVDQRTVTTFLEMRAGLDLDSNLEQVRAANLKLLTWTSAAYPPYLREVPAAPPVLYMAGEMKEVDRWAVAVVGTRRLTSYGRQVTRDLVTGLVRHHVTIVSGLAKGIDTIAHETAVGMGGRTIAVLGSGLNQIYPSENRALARQIVREGHGAILTEYALGVPPDAKNFPPRNRVISGLSLGTVVIEAGERSGALITANFALEQNREVFAIPGNINSRSSKGTNRLIQQGAKLVSGVEDILEELNLTMVPQQVAVQMALPESAEEAALLRHLTPEPTHVDDLTRACGLPSSQVSSTLTLMELKGMVQQVGGMRYVLSREPAPVYTTEPVEGSV